LTQTILKESRAFTYFSFTNLELLKLDITICDIQFLRKLVENNRF